MRHCTDCGRRLPDEPRSDGLGRPFPLCGRCDDLLTAQMKIRNGEREWMEKFWASLELIVWKDKNIKTLTPEQLAQRPTLIDVTSNNPTSLGMEAIAVQHRRDGRDE